jgi:hypothetical protein
MCMGMKIQIMLYFLCCVWNHGDENWGFIRGGKFLSS